MKTLTPLPLLALVLTITLRLNAQPFMVLQPHSDPEIPEASHSVIWSTVPSVLPEWIRVFLGPECLLEHL